MTPAATVLEQCVRVARDAGGGIEPGHVALFVLLALVLAGIVRSHLKRRHAWWFDVGHPLLHEAAARARTSWPLMRELHAAHPGEVTARFRIVSPDDGETVDLAWGRLLDVHEEECTSTVEGKALSGIPPVAEPITVRSSQLLDWQYVTPVGDVRGGFSAQAQVRLYRQRRKRLPAQVASMQGRFVDS